MMKPALGPTAVQLAGQHMLTELEQLVSTITDQVWKLVPYNDILIERSGLEAQVRPNILDALNFMITGRDIDDADRHRLEALGQSRALQGVPLAAMIQSFRVGERHLIDAFCVFCIRAAFNSAEQRSGIQAISAIMDKLELVTIEAYRETQEQLQYDHNTRVAVLVTSLVDGSAGDRVSIDAQARLVGANPSIPYRCVALSVMWPDKDAQDPSPELSRLRRHIVTRLIEARIPGPISGTRDDALILLVPATERDALGALRRAIGPRQYRFDVVGGSGDVYDSLFEARASCQEALAALDVGMRQQRRHDLVMYGDVVLDVMLLGNRDASRRLIASYLGALDEHAMLTETIREYIGLGLSAQATADRLVVHVNTIAYRLRRVRELTGHDVRNPNDAVGFSLALRARDLLAS
jgi:hypothetical protein